MAKTGSIHTVPSAIPVPSVNAKKALFLRGIGAVIVMAGRKKFPRKAASKFEVLKETEKYAGKCSKNGQTLPLLQCKKLGKFCSESRQPACF